MAVQQFCLRWNNHQPNFISVFTNLLTTESLVDVTLAAEGKQLQAHKVVLSACSTYFQSLFTTNPCQHPIVILKDIKYSDLKTLVDFMYYGEVNVSQDQLPAILKTAETLKIKGLAEMPELSLSKSVSQSSDKCESPSPISPSVLRRKRLRKSSTGSGSEQTSEETPASGSGSVDHAASPVKAEPDETHISKEPSTESDIKEGSHSFEEESYAPTYYTYEIIIDPLGPEQSENEDLSVSRRIHLPIKTNRRERKKCVNSHRNLSEEGESNIRWSSSEEQKPGPSSQPTQVVETLATPSMGSKRGRLLMRQHRIKKDCEMSQLESESEPPKIERQYSEPTPNLLSVPQHSYLIKQNSSPHLTTPSPAIQTPQPQTNEPQPQTSKPRQEETRKTTTNQCQNPSSQICEGSRSCHCPVLRPGPALGCNFCWNTIDTHGRILRRKTKYHCPECQSNLCIVPCFQQYHERVSSNTNRDVPCTSNQGTIPTITKTFSL